jgi:SAM-dependent methyltransferase
LGEKAASLLVIGACAGNELSAWGPSNSNWTFTGVDPSEEMLTIAKNKMVQLGMESRVRLIQGTIDDLPLPDSKFDAASCILVLHFIDDIQEKLKLLGNIKNHLVMAVIILDKVITMVMADIIPVMVFIMVRAPLSVRSHLNDSFLKDCLESSPLFVFISEMDMYHIRKNMERIHN